MCSSSLYSHNVIWWGKVILRPTFPLLAVESLAGVDPGCRSPAQLCLPASVRLFIPGCACVFVGMWRVVELHRCVCVCVRAHVSLSAVIPLPGRLFQNTSLIKVGQNYFYRKAIFRRCSRLRHLRLCRHGEE